MTTSNPRWIDPRNNHGWFRPDTIRRVLAWLRFRQWPLPPGSPHDPFAWKPAPLKPRPKGRSGAVAVAEPDE